MKYIVLLVLMTLLKISSVFAQYDIKTVKAKAEKIILTNFDGRLNSLTYLLYNLEDKYLLIEKRDKGYMLFFIRQNAGIEDSVCINKRNRILKIAFDPKSCIKMPISGSSDARNHPHSKYIYFFLSNKGMRYCEFLLPALFNEDISGEKIYPLNERVHEFLVKKMFTRWKD